MYTQGFEILAVGGSWRWRDRRGVGRVLRSTTAKRLRRARALASSSCRAQHVPPLHPGMDGELGPRLPGKSATRRRTTWPAPGGARPSSSRYHQRGRRAGAAKSYMQALRKAAIERGMLLIFDEAQTAFRAHRSPPRGGLLRRYAGHRQRSPDMGGGFRWRPCPPRRRSRKTSTPGASPSTSHVSTRCLPATVGLAVLRTIQQEAPTIEACPGMGALSAPAPGGTAVALRSHWRCARRGMLLGVELVKSRETRRPTTRWAPHHHLQRCYEAGPEHEHSAPPGRSSVWRIAPPSPPRRARSTAAWTSWMRRCARSIDEIARNRLVPA